MTESVQYENLLQPDGPPKIITAIDKGFTSQKPSQSENEIKYFSIVLGEYVIIPKVFLQNTSLSTAIYLSLLISTRDYLLNKRILPKDEFFFFTERKASRFRISRYAQKEAIKFLSERGLVDSALRRGKTGVKQRFFKLNNSAIISFFYNVGIEPKSAPFQHENSGGKALKSAPLETEDQRKRKELLRNSLHQVSSSKNKEGNKVIRLKKEKTYIPSSIQPYLDAWKEHGFNNHGQGTLALEESVQSLKKLTTGVFFADKREYSKEYSDYKLNLEDFNLTLDRLKMMFKPEYQPYKKSALPTTLYKFFYNLYSPIKSQFIHCLTHRPKLLKIKGADSESSEMVAKKFGELVLGNKNFQPSNDDWNRFDIAGNKLNEFFNKPEYKNDFSLSKKATLLIESIKDHNQNRFPITAGFTCSRMTFEDRLPRYLKKQAVIMTPPKKSMRELELEYNQRKQSA